MKMGGLSPIFYKGKYMNRVIGVIAANQQDFIHFCKENGFSLGSELIRNLINEPSTFGLKFSCLYITELAYVKRHSRELSSIAERVIQHLQPLP
jgi:hypothetical protein